MNAFIPASELLAYSLNGGRQEIAQHIMEAALSGYTDITAYIGANKDEIISELKAQGYVVEPGTGVYEGSYTISWGSVV